MKLCSLFVGKEGRDCERELENCLGDFYFGVVGELDAPRFVEDVSMVWELRCEFGTDDVDFCSIIEEEFEWFVFNEYGCVLKLGSFARRMLLFVVSC